MALPLAADVVWRDSGMACVLIQEQVELCGAQAVAERLQEEEYQDHLRSLCLDLVPLLAPSATSTPGVLQLFHHMARVCSAKEMNLALLEALDTSDSLPVALKLLHTLQSVMDRLPASNKLRVVGGTTSAVVHRLHQLWQHQKGPVSQSEVDMLAKSCEEEEEEDSAKPCTTMDNLEYMVDVLGFWRAASGVFLHAWVEAGGRMNNELLTLQSACISGLLSLLADPVATIDLVDGAGGLSTASGQLAKQAVELLFLLKCGLHTLVSKGPTILSTSESFPLEPLNEGLACLCYLWMAEGVCWSMRPTPLRDAYLVARSFKHAAVLLSGSDTVCVKKGLCLVQKCFELVSCGSLDRADLVDSSWMVLLQALSHVAVYCDSKTLRSASVTAFRGVVGLFDAEARHRLYRIMFHQITHPGLWGLLAHDLKDEVNRAIRGDSPESPFLGDRLLPLLYTVCRLPALEEETSVLKESDRLMASVNFLRFLLLADNHIPNKTSAWCHVGYWRDSLCQPLLDAVESSKDHHAQMLEQAERNGRGRGSKEGMSLPEVTVNVSGKVLDSPEMDEWDDKQALAASLLQLEVLQETTLRLMEIMDEQNHVPSAPDAT